MLRSLFTLVCMMLQTNAETAPLAPGQKKEPRFSKQPRGFKFLSKLDKEFKEITDFNTFAQESRRDGALRLVVFYSNEYCLNCVRQEAVLSEVYDRYKHHIR